MKAKRPIPIAAASAAAPARARASGRGYWLGGFDAMKAEMTSEASRRRAAAGRPHDVGRRPGSNPLPALTVKVY